MSPLQELENALSPYARHALETYRIAFTEGDPSMSVGDIRAMIDRLYGYKVQQELEDHLKVRVSAMLAQPEIKRG